MELRHVRYFVAVAEQLHFGNAARLLHVAQPALSVQIKQLENMLGGELFHRANRSVTLTEAGRLFYVEAKKILEQTMHAEAVVKAALKGQTATFDIGYSGSAAFSGALKRAIDAIRSSGSSIEINLQEMDPYTQLDELLARRIQFGFLTTTQQYRPPEVYFMPLASWPILLAMHRTHPLAAKEQIAMADLDHEGFVVYATNPDETAAMHFQVELGFTPKISQIVKSGTMVVPMVAAGMGIALLPSSMIDPHFGDDVIFRQLVDLDAQLDCSLVYLHEQHEPAVQRALASIEAEFLAEAQEQAA